MPHSTDTDVIVCGTGAAVTGAGGLPTRLFGLFQGPHWTLLGHDTVELGAVEAYLDTVGVRPLMTARPPASDSGTPDSAGSAPRTRRGHRQVRTAAEKRLATAQRELHHLSRQVQRDLRTVRRQGETTAIVARSNLADLAVQGITRLAAGLRTDRTDR
nr:hypothetical protein OG999_47690 [Streptomyces sp. NBC_00886]